MDAGPPVGALGANVARVGLVSGLCLASGFVDGVGVGVTGWGDGWWLGWQVVEAGGPVDDAVGGHPGAVGVGLVGVHGCLSGLGVVVFSI